MYGPDVWAYWLGGAMVGFGTALALVALSCWVTDRLARVREQRDEDLAAAAESFGEPTREQVEDELVDLSALSPEELEELLEQALTLDDLTLFGDADAYFNTARFDTEVLASLDAIPMTSEVGHG